MAKPSIWMATKCEDSAVEFRVAWLDVGVQCLSFATQPLHQPYNTKVMRSGNFYARRKVMKLINNLVGTRGFEPPTPTPPV